MNSGEYVLGRSANAVRRLAIQDRQHAAISEAMLDQLQLRPEDRVVELGVGTGNFSRRIMRRLGERGVLVGVDYTKSLLDEARRKLTGKLTGSSRAQFELVLDDIRSLGTWLDQADVVTGRTILHHIPMVEALVGALRDRVRVGTRIGFVEPEFRIPAARIGLLEQQGRKELAPLRHWAEGIVRYYQVRGLSPEIGASLPQVLDYVGFQNIASAYHDFPVDQDVIDNALLYYDEIGANYMDLGIMTAEEIGEQKRYFASLQGAECAECAMWGMHYATCVA